LANFRLLLCVRPWVWLPQNHGSEHNDDDDVRHCLLMSAIRSMLSYLFSRSLAHDAGMHYSEGPFHFLDGAVGASDHRSACFMIKASPITT